MQSDISFNFQFQITQFDEGNQEEHWWYTHYFKTINGDTPFGGHCMDTVW